MGHHHKRLALADFSAVLLIILVAWIVSRWWLYPILGVADNAPMILRPISGFLAAWWLLSRHGERLAFIGLSRPTNPLRTGLVAILLYAVLALTSPWISSVLAEMLPADTRPGFMGYIQGNLLATLCWIAIGWVVGGFCEEVLFRGFLLNRIASLLGGSA